MPTASPASPCDCCCPLRPLTGHRPRRRPIGCRRSQSNSFWDGDQLFTLPPTTDTVERLRVRVNNFPLTNCRVEAGWFVFDASPDIFAVGENLIGISLPAVTTESSMTVEKLEAHVLFSV